MKPISFKDRVVVQVLAGNGGNGCCSFRREKFIDKGGPDGGDGGRGGSVYLKGDKDVDSLVNLYFQPIQQAEHGGHGKGAQRTGPNGKDLVIPVPCGTQAWDVDSPPVLQSGDWKQVIDFSKDEDEDTRVRTVYDEERRFLGEVVKDGDMLMVAKCGTGGKGNQHFATPSHQAPTEHTLGTKGEIRKLILELKTVADVGLVGYPNAGKSTLLGALTHAKPKVAAYPFTTLNPIIGTLQYEDFTTLRIADIPGLIKDAHKGIGLGHDFLRHIERSGFLLFVIDMAGTDGRDPVDDYKNLRLELGLYSDQLNHRPFLVAANKMDVPEAAANLKRFRRSTKLRPVELSASNGQGIEEIKQALHDWKHARRSFVAE